MCLTGKHQLKAKNFENKLGSMAGTGQGCGTGVCHIYEDTDYECSNYSYRIDPRDASELVNVFGFLR